MSTTKYNQISTIDKLLNTRCSHSPYGTKEMCTDISKNIIDYMKSDENKNEKITGVIFMKFLIFITQFFPNSCANKNIPIISEVLSLIFTEFIPSIEIINKLLIIREYDSIYQNLNKNPKFRLNDQYIDAIIDNRLQYNIDNNEHLCNFLINNIQLNSNNLIKLCKCANEYISTFVSRTIDKTTEKITCEYINNVCKALPHTKQILISLLNKGCILDTNHLCIACSNCTIDGIELILQISRIPITKAHYQAIITSKIYKLDNCTIIENKGFNQEKLELLIKYGYDLDYDDILFSIKHHIELPNIERFKIKLDKNLLEKCWENDFYPLSYNFDCIQPGMIHLQKMCKTKKIKEIKLLIKKYNLIPDEKCIENCCKFKNNNSIFNYLIGLGGKVTLNCIKNCSKEMSNNSFLLNIINNYEEYK